MGSGLGAAVGVVLLVGVTSLGAATSLTGEAKFSLLSDLDPEQPNTAFQLDTALLAKGDTQKGYLVAELVRPTDPYENFKVPKIVLQGEQAFALLDGVDTSVYLTGYLLNVDGWRSQGYMTKYAAGVMAVAKLSEFLTLTGKLGPIAYLNEFQQTTDGKDLPRYGLMERISLGFKRGRTHLDLHLVVEQNNLAYGWANDYSTQEALYYDLTDDFSFGVEHTLLSSIVDTSTGKFRSLNIFDNRKSNFAAFVQYQL